MNNRNTIGLDMGDRKHSFCVLNCQGKVVLQDTVSNTSEAIRKRFEGHPPALFAVEAGTHSSWVSRVLEQMGHEVLVGNPRKLRAIWQSDRKDDVRDAEMLARIARFDPELLYPVRHRSQAAQFDLTAIKARDLLVRTRSMQTAFVRSVAKGAGERIAGCDTKCFHQRAREQLSEGLVDRLEPVLTVIEELNRQIAEYDRQIESMCRQQYPETALLRQVPGVGAITALTFVLTIEDPKRFSKSRDVGPFLGLVPRRDQSGQTDRQMRITKAGNAMLRRLLVGSAQYVLGAFGPDCELRGFGLKLAERGGKNAKRRAVVAVARKLAVLLHRLWIEQSSYCADYQHRRRTQAKAA